MFNLCKSWLKEDYLKRKKKKLNLFKVCKINKQSQPEKTPKKLKNVIIIKKYDYRKEAMNNNINYSLIIFFLNLLVDEVTKVKEIKPISELKWK